MIDKRYMRKEDIDNMSQTPQEKPLANHMWKGFSEIEIFWVNFNFKKSFSYSYIIFENQEKLVKLERA